MQVGLTDLGGIRSRSSSSGISSRRYPSFSSWMFRSWLICWRRRTERGEWWVGAAFPYDRAVNKDQATEHWLPDEAVTQQGRSFQHIDDMFLYFNVYLQASTIFIFLLGLWRTSNLCLKPVVSSCWVERGTEQRSCSLDCRRNSQTGQVQTILCFKLWASFSFVQVCLFSNYFLWHCSLHVLQVRPRLDTKYPMGRANECS